MAVTGLHKELLLVTQKVREAQTSGGYRKVGASYRCMVAPCLGKFGEEKRVKRESKADSKGEIWRRGRS